MRPPSHMTHIDCLLALRRMNIWACLSGHRASRRHLCSGLPVLDTTRSMGPRERVLRPQPLHASAPAGSGATALARYPCPGVAFHGYCCAEHGHHVAEPGAWPPGGAGTVRPVQAPPRSRSLWLY